MSPRTRFAIECKGGTALLAAGAFACLLLVACTAWAADPQVPQPDSATAKPARDSSDCFPPSPAGTTRQLAAVRAFVDSPEGPVPDAFVIAPEFHLGAVTDGRGVAYITRIPCGAVRFQICPLNGEPVDTILCVRAPATYLNVVVRLRPHWIIDDFGKESGPATLQVWLMDDRRREPVARRIRVSCTDAGGRVRTVRSTRGGIARFDGLWAGPVTLWLPDSLEVRAPRKSIAIRAGQQEIDTLRVGFHGRAR